MRSDCFRSLMNASTMKLPHDIRQKLGRFCSALGPAVLACGLVLTLASRATAQTCRGTEVMDRDHPIELGPVVSFGEDTTSFGAGATFGNRSEYVGGEVDRVSSGATLFGPSSNASVRLSATGGLQLHARKKAISICPFATVTHVGGTDTGLGGSSGGTLSFEGGAHVGFGGARTGEFRIVPLVGGGVVHSRVSTLTPRGTPLTTSTTNGALDIGVGLVREDSTSVQIGYAFVFNSARTTSTFIVSLTLALGHK
jgi:hypothetical protein